MRITILITIFLTASVAYSQSILFEKEVKLKLGFINAGKREAYPVIDETNQQMSLFLVDRNSIKAIFFDKDFALLDTLECEKLESDYPELLGSIRVGNVYTLFFSSKSLVNLASISFDYDNNIVIKHKINLDPKKEKYAGSISYNRKFYILTNKKNSSILNLYTFTSPEKFAVNSFDFKEEHFGEPVPYHKISNVLFENPFKVIDNEIPNSIETVSKKNKLYCYDNKMVLTFDHLYWNTKIISIDLMTFVSSLKVYKKGRPECGNTTNISSSSYIYKSTLYQFVVCPLAMDLSIKNLKTDELLKKFQVSKDQELYFKNTSIIQQRSVNGSIDDSELNKTKQFLRKVSGSEAGVCAYKNAENLEITLGGNRLIVTGGGGGMMGPVGGGTISTPYGPVAMPTYAPTHTAYSSYKSTNAVYFKALLDTLTFEHKEGVIHDNALDKMRKYSAATEEDVTAETVFRSRGSFVLGYYLKSKRSYIMRRFTDNPDVKD